MIAITVVCLWLGLIASSARRQRIAVAELARLGATVQYDRRAEDLCAPDWLRLFLGDDFLLNVEYVQLHHGQEGRKWRPLTAAEIDEAVAAMARLPRLTRIYFAHTGVRGHELKRFAPLANQIEELYFNEGFRSNLTGQALRHLSSWPRLTSLGVPFGTEDSRDLELLAGFPALTQLRWGNQSLDEAAFRALARCQRLEQLSLYMCRFDGAAFSRLHGAPALRGVLLHNTRPECFDGYAPANEFHFIPDNGEAPWDPSTPQLPEQRYREWLKKFLPGIDVSEMSTS